MVKKKKSVKKKKPAPIFDLSKLTPKQLLQAFEEVRQAVEVVDNTISEKKLAKFKLSDKAKKIKFAIKELGDQYKAVPKKQSVVYDLKLHLDFEFKQTEDDPEKFFLDQYPYGYNSLFLTQLFKYSVKGRLTSDTMNKDLLELLNDQTKQIIARACGQIAELSPISEELDKMVDNFSKIKKTLNATGYSLEEIKE